MMMIVAHLLEAARATAGVSAVMRGLMDELALLPARLATLAADLMAGAASAIKMLADRQDLRQETDGQAPMAAG